MTRRTLPARVCRIAVEGGFPCLPADGCHTCDPAASGATVRCCVCGGGPVVYRNHLEQPFCWPCADCRCSQTPCVRTGVADPAVSAEAAESPLRALIWAAGGPPPGVSRWWDQRLAELDNAIESPDPGTPVRHVHVTITNPDAYTANRAALSLVDWVRAEFGDSLTLHVTTDAREWDGEKTGEQQ